MRPVTVSVGPLTASTSNNIALAQSLSAAGALTLNGSLASGGVARIANPQRIGITSVGNDSARTWTVTGTNWSGAAISETFAGATAGNTVNSVLSYASVSSISLDGATAGNVTVGTTGLGSSPWVRFDNWAHPTLAIQCVVTGTANYTFESSFDDPNDLVNAVAPASMAWDSTISPLVGASASAEATVDAAPLWGRISINSGTGSVRAVFTQYLNVAS